MQAKQADIYADSSHGIYIPQFFAESHNPAVWTGFDKSAIDILMKGPDSESYWDAWQEVLDNAECIDGGFIGKLHQGESGDLFVIYPELAIEAIQAALDQALEYAESHIDSGDAYAHMPAESWSSQSTRDLMKSLAASETHEAIDAMGLDPDTIVDLALDGFAMKAGHIFGASVENPQDWIVLDAYPIVEIETQLEASDIGLDELTFDYVKESREFCSNGNLFYQTTDSVWYAMISRKKLQRLICAHCMAKV